MHPVIDMYARLLNGGFVKTSTAPANVSLRIEETTSPVTEGDALVVDFGVEVPGGVEAGLMLVVAGDEVLRAVAQ